MANFIQAGDIIDYTPSSALAAGSVVVFGDGVGVVKQAIPANTLGALHLTGVYEFPKATGAVTLGARLYWDATNSKVTTTDAVSDTNNPYVGRAVEAAESADTSIKVRLEGAGR